MDDDDLLRMLLGEIPEPGENYWTRIDRSLGLIDRPDESRLNEEASDSTSIALRPGGRRHVAVVPLAIAAAVLLIAGWFAGTRIASTSDERVETGLADEPAPDAVDGDATPGPRANLDHWNAVYGVWDCTLNDGAGGWLEAFQSDKDDWGIHSHKDGLISIHPFSEEAAGLNATFRLFAESMGIVVDDDRMVLDDGRILADGTTCNGEPAQVHIRRWNSDLALQRDPSIPATVVTENLGAERFSNDREVWVLAFAPVTATIPPPPAERFELLNRSSPADYAPTTVPLPATRSSQCPDGFPIEVDSDGDGITDVCYPATAAPTPDVDTALVQIQPRLVEQSDQILFTVETTQRAYWRIAALDVFDGSLWRSDGLFHGADDALEVRYPTTAPVDLVTQTFDLGEHDVGWAPAAYLPTRFTNLSTAGVNFDAESATFIVDSNDQGGSDGLRYTIESQIPQFTPELLTQLGSQNVLTIDQRYLDLPDDYSPLARAEAERVTAGLTDPYAKALALQNYFRENFTYDVDVAKGHDIRRVEDFLTIQRGYSEQFAGTYASMARAIGLPSRVATGFTPGEPDPANPNRYLVRGRHAHAWPEVFIAGAGWVAFEPTPGRGAPNASAYTGVPEAQDTFG